MDGSSRLSASRSDTSSSITWTVACSDGAASPARANAGMVILLMWPGDGAIRRSTEMSTSEGRRRRHYTIVSAILWYRLAPGRVARDELAPRAGGHQHQSVIDGSRYRGALLGNVIVTKRAQWSVS